MSKAEKLTFRFRLFLVQPSGTLKAGGAKKRPYRNREVIFCGILKVLKSKNYILIVLFSLRYDNRLISNLANHYHDSDVTPNVQHQSLLIDKYP